MAKARRKQKAITTEKRIDATPERLAMGESDMVNPAEIDSKEQPIGLTRRFSSSTIERLYKNERLSWRQFYAGQWYQQTYERCRFTGPGVAGYGERTGAGANPGDFGYGLPQQEAAVRARQELAKARGSFTPDMRGFMERLLIRDEMPKYGGRAAMRNLGQISGALERLANYLCLPG